MVKCPNLGFLSYKPNVGGWRLAECKHAVMGQPALRRARAVASCPWWTSSSTLESLGMREARLGEPREPGDEGGETRGALPGSDVQRVYKHSDDAEALRRTGEDQEGHGAPDAGARVGQAQAEDGGQEEPWRGAQATGQLCPASWRHSPGLADGPAHSPSVVKSFRTEITLRMFLASRKSATGPTRRLRIQANKKGRADSSPF